MAFNRSRGGGRDFNRPARPVGGPRFNDRGSRGPVEMHKAVCDQCHKECEVPFRPTSGKPIFCSNCFEQNRGSDLAPRRFSTKGGPASGWEGRNNDRGSSFEDRPMFDAVCDECGNPCKVPFQPRGDKPIYCSNCFGDNKGASENGSRARSQSPSISKEQLDVLNAKLDRILKILDPKVITEIIKEEDAAIEEVNTPVVESPKKKSPKKK